MCEDACAMRPASISGATGSLLVLLTTLLYLVIINSQGNVDTRRVTVWVVTLALCASLGTAASWSRQPRARSIILATTAGALLGLGFLGIFSIGLLLVAAGVLLSVATVKTVTEDRSGSMLLPFLLGAIAFAGAPMLLLWII
jgi:magnesium-transporting ATPase (P-type)